MNAIPSKTTPNLWPHAIISWFVIFAAALIAWITFAMRQKLDLVRTDYYEEEVHFQNQLNRLNRTAALGTEVTVTYLPAQHELNLVLPAAHRSQSITGQVDFYRPADASLDFRVPLAVDAAGRQRIGTQALRGGRWKVRVSWHAAPEEYFFEQAIVVDEAAPIFTTTQKHSD